VACALGALVVIVGVSVLLLVVDLLWVVPVPELVLLAVLAAAAAPGLVPALRLGERWWLGAAITYGVAVLAGCVIGSMIEPSNRVLAGVLADVPVPAGAGPIEARGCRFCLRGGLWFNTPPQASREIETDDLERVCREVTDQLVRDGWRWVDEAESGCEVNLTKRVLFGRAYQIIVGITPAGIWGLPGGMTEYRDSQVLLIVSMQQ
jgi:hypothetical protein